MCAHVGVPNGSMWLMLCLIFACMYFWLLCIKYVQALQAIRLAPVSQTYLMWHYPVLL